VSKKYYPHFDREAVDVPEVDDAEAKASDLRERELDERINEIRAKERFQSSYMALTGVKERTEISRKKSGESGGGGFFSASASAPQLELAGRAAAPATQAHIPKKPDSNWSQVPLSDTRSCLRPEKQAEIAAAKQARADELHAFEEKLLRESQSSPNLWNLKKFEARKYKEVDYSHGPPSLNSEGLRDTLRAGPAWKLAKSADWKSDVREKYNMVLHQPSIVGKYESGMYGGRRARGYFQHKSIYHKVQPEEVSGQPRYMNMTQIYRSPWKEQNFPVAGILLP